VHYIVNSSGSLSRPAKEILKIPGTLFYSGDAGFTICSVSEDFLRFFFINSKGETIYNYTIAK
jgi:hypothetical protein